MGGLKYYNLCAARQLKSAPLLCSQQLSGELVLMCWKSESELKETYHIAFSTVFFLK